jgi:hypothetical protein
MELRSESHIEAAFISDLRLAAFFFKEDKIIINGLVKILNQLFAVSPS